MLTTKANFILEKGKAVWYDFYQVPNGSCWVVKYKESFYDIVDDGTGNGFYSSGEPVRISEEEAKERLSSNRKAWKEAQEKFGWETLDEYFEKVL